MSITLRNVPTYALTDSIPNLSVRQLIVYALADPRPELPKGKTGFQAVKEMILSLTNHTFPEGTLQIGLPEPSASQLGNSTVLVTALEGSQLSGDMLFYYRRMTVGEALENQIAPGAINPSSYASVHAMLAALVTATGIELITDDFEDLPISGNTALLRATDSSYFFIPGSEHTITA